MPPTRPTMTRAESMKRLQLLSAQQEILHRRLALQVPSSAPLSPFTVSPPEYHSPSYSPTSSRSSSGMWSPEDHSSAPVPTVPSTAHSHALETSLEDAHKLCEINQQIKATLTEMLNTDSVRSDEKYRAWVQERLMDVEQQIRRQRRRHSSAVDREFASSIAMNMSPGRPHRMSWR